MSFKMTPKQLEAIKLMASPATDIMVYGGSRSGKSFLITKALVIRAIKEPGSRHLAVRQAFNHIKNSLWHETIPNVMRLCFPGIKYKPNKVDYFIEFPGGSELWIAGLDDKDRTEKILGKEYSTIFFNECSQISYPSIEIAKTRLAQKNRLIKKSYYDENPPTKRHWSYSLFIQGKNPENLEDIKNKDKYASMVINPKDNLDNIDDNYINDILGNLSMAKRRRFEFGEFTDEGQGLLYYAFDKTLNVTSKAERNNQLPIWIGMDFNVNPMAAVLCNVTDTSVIVFDEIYLEKSHTKMMAQEIIKRYGAGHKIVPDATGKALKTSAAGISDHQILREMGFIIESSNNPYRSDRYNAVNKLLEERRLIINPRCIKLIKDLDMMAYKEGSSSNEPDDRDKSLGHISDALGYLVFKTHGIYRKASSQTIRL